ncbi:ABC transporter ATP-binding protein [Pseudomonas sp. NA-150]|uniref:ABC transporter ATP-binding protein n=1 Tax=Pseudomonas sp. NA-150 TaxID=3367525 RepID=UPI0037CB82AC
MSLSAEQINISYGRRSVIRNLSLPTLQPGTLTALIGPNGAGKSTLLRAMAGLEKMTGSLYLDGRDLTRLSIPERARHVTYMPQSLPPNLELSVLECVLAAVRSSASDPLLAPRQRALPDAFAALQEIGIAHLANDLLSNLSGGQRQLVSLAQLIARRPRVMLLDEPTSALDLNYQLKVMHCVQTLVRQHQSIAVVVLHDINLAARFADTLAVLHDGQLFASGSPQNVLTPALFQQVYGVAARIERCSRQSLQVVVDRALG